VHPNLREKPPQRLAAGESRADELEKRIRALDGDDFERLTGTSSGVTIHRAATVGPKETKTRRHRQTRLTHHMIRLPGLLLELVQFS
jgi:hypothetical protein